MKTLGLYFKLVQRSAIGNFLMYTAIFLFIIIISSNLSPVSNTTFEVNKVNATVINRDNSVFSQKLTEYMEENTVPVAVEDNAEKMNDALFFTDTSIILIIPEGFGDSFLSGGDKQIDIMESAYADRSALVKQVMNNYLTASSLYLSAKGEIDYDAVKADVSKSANIVIEDGQEDKASNNVLRFMNMLAYPFLGIFTSCVVEIMMIINKRETRCRTLCSPMNPTKYTMKIYLGNVIFALAVFALFIIAGFILMGEQLAVISGLLMIINAFALAMVCLTLSFMLGTIISKRAVLSGVSNVLSLGFCFLGGAFVEQEYLTDVVKNIAVVNPVYWFIDVNNTIASLGEINLTTIQPAIGPFLIELCFIPIFITIALIVAKQKRTSTN